MNIATLPKKGLKTRPYNVNMNKEDRITTLPKRGLKTRPYKMDMEKKDLKKLTKRQLIKLLLKQKKSKKVSNHEDLLDNNPFKDEVAQEPSGWVIDSINNHYINVTTYKPLHGSSYIELPKELQNSAKGLINMKNKEEECFRWCHIRHLNPQKKDPQIIKKEDKRLIEGLNYEGIEFPVSQKIKAVTSCSTHKIDQH